MQNMAEQGMRQSRADKQAGPPAAPPPAPACPLTLSSTRVQKER